MDKLQCDKMVRGEACPFDTPRAASNEYWDFVAPLSVAYLYLSKNQAYRGQCLLILDICRATHPQQLSGAEWAAFCADLHTAEKTITRVTQ